MKSFVNALNLYRTFSGRLRRRSYWSFILFSFIIYLLLAVIDSILEQQFLSFLYAIIMIIPTLAASVRRVHDVGKSGWFLLVPIYSYILLFSDGTIGENIYGADPKGRNINYKSEDIVEQKENHKLGFLVDVVQFFMEG